MFAQIGGRILRCAQNDTKSRCRRCYVNHGIRGCELSVKLRASPRPIAVSLCTLHSAFCVLQGDGFFGIACLRMTRNT